jgi:hypothetical protein
MRKISSLCLLICIHFSSYAQVNSQVKTLHWTDTLRNLEFSDYRMHPVLYFTEAAYDESAFGFLPYYFESVALPFAGTATVTLADEQYLPLLLKRGGANPDYLKQTENAPIIKVGYGTEKTKPVANISILPLRRNPATGAVEKLVSFRYIINVTPDGSSGTIRGAEEYAPHSVLASGNWYKVAVGKDGIYKMDKSFLDGLGINTAGIDPRNIRVYGNGGGMLPEANSVFRFDDLQENAIKVVGEEDGHFDAGDFVLFYAQSPDRWSYDATTKKFIHTQHLYSNSSFYFITTDIGAGKRVAEQPSLPETANVTVNSFDDYASHEVNLDNLLESGRDWVGESFEFETSQSFPFNFSNILTSAPVYVTALVASKSIYSSNYFTMKAAGITLVNQKAISPVCAEYTCPVANTLKLDGQFTATSGSFNVELDYTKVAQDAVGWLNYIEINLQRSLAWTGSQMNFRNVSAAVPGNISQYLISNANGSLLVWDVTSPTSAKNQLMTLSGTELQFNVANDSLHEFVVFANNEGIAPSPIGKIANQDLHGLSQVDFLIVSPSSLLTQANDLAGFHRDKDGMTVNVVPVEQVYNEFSSGAQDIGAIRDFARMFYKRANGDVTQMPKYLLLFGDGSYDNKGYIEGNTAPLPTYQSANSTSPTSSFVSDDFFGLLDDNEGGNILDPNAKMDIAVGRLPVNTTEEANEVINKIKIYSSPESFGNWRNVVTFVADDEDNNVHINDADEIANSVGSANPVYNIDKIFLDAYHQVAIPGGSRYPDVNTAINNRICSGTLIMNYVGHGGVGGWGHERILSISDIESYTNLYKLALYVTATCEFSKYDDPAVTSAGELLLLNTQGGAIALVTTVRLVYSSANKLMNQGFMNNVFLPVDGKIPPLGEVFRKGKNSIGGDTNNRKFTLLGDPALTLDYAAYNISTTSIDMHPVGSVQDTLKALQKVTISGNVTDLDGNLMSDFNGTLFPTVYDKPVTYQTLQNDPASLVKNFILQKNIIYNGKASVKNGAFTFSFIVPKDISYQYGFGKLSYYGDNGVIDAHGYKNDIVIGGVADSVATDVTGPEVKVFMNDDKFVFGGITDENPSILVKINDTNGVNTVGTGIGHDLTGILDNDSKNTLVMNDFYTADLDSYQAGEARYPLKSIAEGKHSISVKAWDVYNNSSEGYTEFIVSTSAKMALAHVLNYPNPFTTRTEFMFEHNMPGQMLNVMVQIYTVSGKLVKTLQQSVMPEMVASSAAGCSDDGSSGGYRVNNIFWDGKDDYGDQIGKGVYVYKLSVQAENGLKADTFEKLVILK